MFTLKKLIIFIYLGTVAAFLGFHQCPHRKPCVYKYGGTIHSIGRGAGPFWGHKWTWPVYEIEEINTAYQTDKVKNVPCGSSKGGTAHLTISVINRLKDEDSCLKYVIGDHTKDYDQSLIFDFIPSEVAQLCKEYSLNDIATAKLDQLDEVLETKLKENIKSYGPDLERCLEIKKVTIDKPDLPEHVRTKFEETELLKKDQEHEQEKAKTAKIKQLTTHQEKEAKAKDKAMEKKYEMDTAMKQAETQSAIKKSEADSDAYAKEKQAESNAKLLTPAFLKLKEIEAYYHNSKHHERLIDSNALKGTNHHTHMRFDSHIPYESGNMNRI